MTFVGIDPGLDGAVAVLEPATTGDLVQFYDTPTERVRGRGRVRRVYRLHEMAEFVQALRGPQVEAALERATARPGQHAASTFEQGYGIGIWEALLAAAGIPYTLIQPSVWKRQMLAGMLREGKGASVIRVQQLFPQVGGLARVKDHNRAEALLLAAWLRDRRGG